MPQPGNRSSSDQRVLVLTRRDVTALLGVDECIDAVEQAFRDYAAGLSVAPQVLGASVAGGGFHIKTAGLMGSTPVFAAKVNANFPGNPAQHNLPTIQGVIALFELGTGRPLALLDSIAITSLRTAAATAVAARHLARPDADVLTICGCGEQGRSQLRALARVCSVRLVLAFDTDPRRSRSYAEEMSAELGIAVEVTEDLAAATRRSAIIVTCTPATRFIVAREQVPAGAFVAGVGADHPHKQELDPALLASSTVVADLLEQCATIGDLHHAIEAGLMTRGDVYAELAEIVAGLKAGRRSDAEVIVFDSTGTALQDVAAALVVCEKARAAGAGLRVELAG